MNTRSIVALSLLPILITAHTITVRAETSTQGLEQQLIETEQAIKDKEAKKEEVKENTSLLLDDLQALETDIKVNSEDIQRITNRINEIRDVIEQKMREIIELQRKTGIRQDLLKERFIALQESDQFNVVVDTIINSEGISDLVHRLTAVSILLNADNEILKSQQEDLEQIEREKEIITEQETDLKVYHEELVTKQGELNVQLNKKQEMIIQMQSHFATLENEITIAEEEKVQIKERIVEVQEQIKREQEEAKLRAQTIAQYQREEEFRIPNDGTVKGIEMYVESTAYSWEETYHNNFITKLGYNIKTDPTLKLIAVDPNVIPLGAKVWVDGYGLAVAGDTGGAIKGHIIDVLMHSKAEAIQWGRKKAVRIIVLK
ncbi:3D domain-containing protein [Bacillus sp. AFS040349]|uniref:3D domain-containing protein n=1 Tax=Bacillus sp. AFS040349 TaxID=2033502 RepID=UPI0026A85E64|nr:3D domain-containing protein [Bacillus sp. AFS040349]